MTLNRLACATFVAGIFMSSASLAEIVHDSEHYILKAQHGERWAAEDKEVDAKLAELREKNGGKPPNILFILVDDVGFGELGNRELNYVRGYKNAEH